ncbi:cupin domain-containing protein [Gloeobacter morelensis]|uniref:Cupin domain-containing protein n=1 Tax=Gloeobacter morelensis MG652769 TaxID=2781736 RepID=A0ABY3PPR9_9CYAN|nr:cupin domain-containing protein [Gloeobacter morelensis]UFP95708.1 cupin domain-containing protein [Gloeobacter morelensis MG652769]
MSPDPCFCELAPLHALDILDERERLLVEHELAHFPELAAELAAYRRAVAVLPYGAPAVAVAADLKTRLFERLDLEKPKTPAVSAPALPYFALRAAELPWEPFIVPGTTIARLRVDEARRELVGVFRAEAGVRYPEHLHAGFEEIFMLEGDLEIDGEVYGPGDYVRSQPGSMHGPSTRGGCMFFIRTSLDDRFVDA